MLKRLGGVQILFAAFSWGQRGFTTLLRADPRRRSRGSCCRSRRPGQRWGRPLGARRTRQLRRSPGNPLGRAGRRERLRAPTEKKRLNIKNSLYTSGHLLGGENFDKQFSYSNLDPLGISTLLTPKPVPESGVT